MTATQRRDKMEPLFCHMGITDWQFISGLGEKTYEKKGITKLQLPEGRGTRWEAVNKASKNETLLL